MIVRYVRERGYQGSGQDPSLTLGKEYMVFGVNSSLYRCQTELSVLSDKDDYPVIWDAKFFDIVDPRIPDGWGYHLFTEDYYRLCPSEFAGDFWDRFHDGDEAAEKVFAEVRAKLMRFHSHLP